MRTYEYPLKSGISRTAEFEKKKLASFAVNVGVKCSHDCLYCSTGAMLRMHPAFKKLGEDPFGHGYAIVDPNSPERVAKDANRIKDRGLIQICTTVDAWAPEAKEYDIGRRCLQAILAQPGWSVRILTKNSSVVYDYEFMRKYRDRILVGLSITATPEKWEVMKVLEPNASPIYERIVAWDEAYILNRLRTYAMFCPLLPGIANSPNQIDGLMQLAAASRAEEIFVEPVNPRGSGLRHCQEALEIARHKTEAKEIEKIRNKCNWSKYVVNLLANVQQSVRKCSEITKLRFLLYPSRLLPEDVKTIRKDDAGVIWLGK